MGPVVRYARLARLEHEKKAECRFFQLFQTPEGDKTFPLVRQDIKTGGIEEGALVTAELNEAGAVIDLHRAKK